MGALSYADDITLVAPSVNGLQAMVNECQAFGDEYCLQFNESKSKAVVFGGSLNITRKIIISGKRLEWVKDATHLGSMISL